MHAVVIDHRLCRTDPVVREFHDVDGLDLSLLLIDGSIYYIESCILDGNQDELDIMDGAFGTTEEVIDSISIVQFD
jgi:hypothetical protein